MKRLVSILFFFPILFSYASASDPVLIEAESFSDTGGWVVDQQFMDTMGSPILMAHGMGEPVRDAVTEYEFPETGTYRVFVRTRNWVAPWTPQFAPGTFRLAVDGRTLETVFGTEGVDWHWQFGGAVEIKARRVRLTLHDQTGFDGRLDAILFTKDANYVPPNDLEAIESLRRRSAKLPDSVFDAPEVKEGPFDLVVVGGGFGGLCTSISAARLGCKVALIQDRPVLGGNNSSEIRVHVRGRINYPPYPNIGNLTYELDPGQYGIAQVGRAYKDDQKLQKVLDEKNITLYLNTHVVAAETKKDGDTISIRSVVGKNVKTGAEVKFIGKFHVDGTGDGNLGFLSGADWRMGRESKEETGEQWAPEKPDRLLMGASVLWYSDYARDKNGETVRTVFPELPWAHRFNKDNAQLLIRGEWDWETGFGEDPIRDAERIRDNGLRAIYGHWDYMKNQSPPEWRDYVTCRKLAWVSYVAGKRESRRLMGDVILREQDILSQRDWPDACVVGTWPIDLHYPDPENSKHFKGSEFKSVSESVDVKTYWIPYRTLYSRNVRNLFMAGRCASATHVALGSTRVMRTCGMMGEIVGMAASIAVRNETTPRGVYENHLPELKKLMEKGVGVKPESYDRSARPLIPGTEPPKSPPDWARNAKKNLATDAKVSVSSSHRNGKHPASFINDGKYDLDSDEGRWMSDIESNLYDNPHWVVLTFDEPVVIDAYRVLSGQASPARQSFRLDAPRVFTGLFTGEEYPMYTFLLQRLDGDRWVDIKGSEVVSNTRPDVWRRFEPVSSRAFRLKITETRLFRARLWELELFKLEEDRGDR